MQIPCELKLQTNVTSFMSFLTFCWIQQQISEFFMHSNNTIVEKDLGHANEIGKIRSEI